MGDQAPNWEELSINPWKREEILVTVKAYPNPSKKYIETVCVAGVTKDGKWVRLYPIPYRYLEYEQRFPTYGRIQANIRKSPKDPRPESYNIDINTLHVLGKLGTGDFWQERRALLLPLVSPSVEALQEQQEASKISLGLIRPKQIKQLVIQPKKDPHWSAEELAKIQQPSLLDEMQREDVHRIIRELEKIPYDFFYEFTCDDPRCRGHKISIISWEVMESYRKWHQNYGDRWESKFREMYEQELPGPKHDFYFFMGTMRKHPKVWLIIGLFYPPSQQGNLIQPPLFGAI
jgi:hypothetical protein